MAEYAGRWIDALLNRHIGETAWLFGKGPSLDQFEIRLAGPLRICINESLGRVLQLSYFFAHDEGSRGDCPRAGPQPQYHLAGAAPQLQPQRLLSGACL